MHTESNGDVRWLISTHHFSLFIAFSSYDDFAFHLHTNTIGPIITARKLLQSGVSIGTIVFISSDSGSMTNFRGFEDGFAAYGASKAALNQMLRVGHFFRRFFVRLTFLT
jgi:NAD(P)-dependent dehydrogenase (short-subunit alcohol dehydrogenase family)